MTTPRFLQPAEWEPHSAVWTAWPSDASLWLDDLGPAREEIAALCRAIADVDPKTVERRGEAIKILACGDDAVASAREMFSDGIAEVISARFGDIWLRDTAPIFIKSQSELRAACFKFNGWGGKYELKGDKEVAFFVAKHSGVSSIQNNWILEGGSLDVDGQGHGLTTRQCLMNPNRNPNLTQDEIEVRLRNSLALEKLIWLDDGLANDHTDGHIDNIARFVAPGVVVCMEPSGADDPNREVLDTILADLKNATDIDGNKFEVFTVPSPGRLENEDGEIIPASFVNFYVANTTVVVPVYGTPYDEVAIERIARLFPTRRTVGLAANHVITGGGSFHCITQQQPAV